MYFFGKVILFISYLNVFFSDESLARSNQPSPLPLGADPEILQQVEDLIGADVFSDTENNQAGDDPPVAAQQLSELNSVSSQNTNQPESVVLHDHFLPSETLTPDMIICPPSVNSFNLNVDSPLLTPIFDDVPQSSPQCESPCNQVPIPSQMNRHENFQDPSCCLHGNKEVNQHKSEIKSSQPFPAVLVTKRKRTQNHERESKKKRLTDGSKTHSSKEYQSYQKKTVHKGNCHKSKSTDKTSDTLLSANALHQNVDLSNLNPNLGDISRASSPCGLPEDQTPMPSPINRHKHCQDQFCCQHDDKEVTQLIQNSEINSNQSSPALVRNRGKKRIRNHKDWGEIKRKRLTNEGKTYCSKRGHIVQEKTMREACRCRYKCSDKVSEDTRKDIFKKFWALGDRAKQWLHIANYTKQEHKKRTYFARTEIHKRIYTYKYFLPKYEEQFHTKIDVCKTMFLNTLGITERMTRTAWQKYDGTTTVEKDMRGFHSHHKKIVDERMIASVCDHVKSFVPVESHYCRKSSTRLYLDGSLSIARMYILYKDWLNEERYDNPAKTLRQYRDIVNSHFNLTFHIPKKDTCDQCHVFKNTENPSDELKTDYANHQKNKKVSRQLKNKDKEDAAQSNGLIVCATFDLQKVLSCPHGQMSILYYKRKLSCYNMTVFDAAMKEGFCYVWDESIAKRGANEVSSCLYDFIKTFAEKGAKEFRLWSDNCAGQNKNRIMFAMYAYAAEKFGVKITHRFLERGHTQNEGDSVHSVIERAGEHKVIYTPEEWKLLIRWAKTTDKPYQVKDVTREVVIDFRGLLSNKNWTKNTAGQKVAWSKIKEVVVEDNNTLLYKYNLEDESMTLVIGKKTRNRGDDTIVLKNAYSQPIPISTEKYKDLKSLVDSGIIPSRYHSFFLGLPHGRVTEMESDSDE